MTGWSIQTSVVLSNAQASTIYVRTSASYYTGDDITAGGAGDVTQHFLE